ncbi:hypothetical protein [Cytobacillus sp. IB215665]|uniref:hypothetical protein n=1 Tax=Cytobacillus sp. IB215665 TaxID=3097357 RepID=UPI002A11ED3A|nr:hypothetical protein [Cytobacillus sp. IB215665]MDX8366035.1 hypothetical protein [Cytobacillus sp. IB215665]
MKRYMKLIDFEFNRFIKLYVVLMGLTFFSQMVGVIFQSRRYVNRANEQIYGNFIPMDVFLQENGTMSFLNISETLFFKAPILFAIVTLILCVFFIWYRDWFGKNTFSYRLLALPTARINLYLAKATTILLLILGLVAFQLLLLLIEGQVFQWIVPHEFRTDLTFIEITTQDTLLKNLIPTTFTEFLLYYGSGMTFVFIAFAVILFERSYHLKGVFYGIIYSGLCLFILLAPLLINKLVLNDYLYLKELFFVELGIGGIILVGSILIGHFLLKKKIMV